MAEEKSRSERLVIALEEIAQSLRTIEDTVLELDPVDHQSRVEWYLHEFKSLFQGYLEGSSNRPPRDNIKDSDNSPVSE